MSVLTDQEIKNMLNKGIVIYPFDETECLSPLGYDLRIGYSINLNRGSNNNVSSGKVIIPPKTSTFIISKEYVWLSGRIVGTLHSRGSLSARGLFLNSTTVDPNWSGQMTFLLYNASDDPVELETGSRFVTMVLFRAKISTHNAPTTNPIKVAENYGIIYGEQFSKSLMAYLTDNINEREKRKFEALVHKAKTPSPSFIIWFGIISLIKSICRFFQKRMSNFISGFIWILAIAALLFGLTIQWYWAYLQRIFHFSEPYGPTVMIGQIAIIVSSLSVLRSLLKK